ncbi:MAG: phosphotransferase family protein [Acidimicrobiales bacterium]
MGDDLEGQLTTTIRRVLDDPSAEVVGLSRLSGGASRETWAFDVRRAGATHERLILRRDPPGAPRMGPGGMRMEARVLAAASAGGVPVPRILSASDDFDEVGAAYIVMERIDGETIPRKILRDDAYASARRNLAAQCGTVLARLHRLSPDGSLGLTDTDQVAQYRETLDTLGEPHPAFELGFRWLEANRPQTQRRSIVHGDFRNGNLIVGPDGLRAVLDWELAHAGDPLEDLGWLCVKAWRFGVDRPVGGFGSYEDLLGAYEAESGTAVDGEALRWWQALGTLKWGIMCIMQATAHTSGMIRSVELAAIGRRVCENEWDLLDLLPPPWNGLG